MERGRTITAIELVLKEGQAQPRRSDIVSFMPPLRGLGDWARRFYKDATPTEFTETRPSRVSALLLNSMAVGRTTRLRAFVCVLAAILCLDGRLTAGEPSDFSRSLLKLGCEQVELRRTDENRLFLFARVNGRKRSCLVDTGWSFTTVSTNTAAHLAHSNLIDRLELGGVSFTNQSVIAQDIRIAGEPASFDVVLGCDFLLAHHAILDCANRRLYLRRTALTLDETASLEKLLADSSRVSAEMKLRSPPAITVAVQLNDHAAEFLVDSGAVWSCLDVKAARDFNLRLSPSPNQISGAVSADKKSFHVTTVRELTVAERKIKDASLAVLSLEPWGFGPDGKLFNDVSGILGGAELIANRAVIDFSSRKLWLRAKRVE